jgi:hypothetical protein
MGFENVDGQESDIFAILLVELVESRNLLPKWRSGVAAKNQHDGLLVGERCQLNFFGLIELQ